MRARLSKVTGTTIGIEEEFFLVDADGIPAPRSADLLAKLPKGFKPEFRSSQIEAVTRPRKTLSALRKDLESSRARLAATSDRLDLKVLPVGTPIHSSPACDDLSSSDERHRGIRELYSGALADYNVCGCQVHVGIDDDDLAIAVL